MKSVTAILTLKPGASIADASSVMGILFSVEWEIPTVHVIEIADVLAERSSVIVDGPTVP